MGRSKVYKLLSDLNKLKWGVAYKGIASGVIGGLLVSLYRLGIEFGTEKAAEAYQFIWEQPVYILPWLLLAAAVSYLTYRLIKLEPYAKGSGIPQVKGIVLLGMKMRWGTILFVRFAAGLLTSFFGVSMGREGPSIQIGASGAQALSKKACRNKVEENYLITSGASAGLSAAFNAPLSGIMFTLEEVHRSFSPNILITATTAALTADIVSKFFFGLNPVLNYTVIPQLPIRFYFWLLILGAVSGAAGVLTNKCLLAVGPIYSKIPAIARPAVALLLALPCGLFLPQVLGGGQNLVQISEEAKVGLPMLTICLLVKLVFTCISFGSGIPGGIFMPILSIGAMTGGIFGQLIINFGLPAEYISAFCACAMAGALSASVKAPITSILLIAEMTGSLVHLLPVALVAFVALLISDMLKIPPIYEVLLDRIAEEEKNQVKKKKPGVLNEVPVEPGSEADGKKISEINWPEGMLIVGVTRGEKEFVPNGETRILHGDYLVVLSSEQQYEEMNRLLCGLCHSN